MAREKEIMSEIDRGSKTVGTFVKIPLIMLCDVKVGGLNSLQGNGVFSQRIM